MVVAHINSRNLIEDLRDHAFMTSAQKGNGRGLETYCVFANSIILK